MACNKTHSEGKEGKASPETGRGGTEGCETSRLKHFLNYCSQMVMKLSALHGRWQLFTPKKFLVLISVRD
jgi:hypothetical protein